MDVMVDYIRDDMLMIYELFGVCGVCVCVCLKTQTTREESARVKIRSRTITTRSIHYLGLDSRNDSVRSR